MLAERFPALAVREFRIFWIGQFISLIGSWMQATTLPYLAYRMTNQPFYLGLIGFASSLPALILTLPGGVWVERRDKRKVVMIMQSVLMMQAFALAALALTGVIQIWHIVLLALVAGTAIALEITARQAMIAELVGRQGLPNAIALNSTAFNLARVIGPTLTAPFLILLQDKGEGWAFFANGISYLFVLASLTLIRSHPLAGAVERRNFMLEFKEGQSFIRATPLVLALILMVAVPSLFGFPFTSQIPVFARDVLATATDTAASVATRNSALVTAQGVGALIAALTLVFFSAMRRKGPLLAAGQYVFAFGLLAFSASRALTPSLMAMVALGWGTVTSLALTNTLIQLAVPDHLRGRVVSTYMWAQLGTAPLGSLLIGWMSQKMGTPTAVLICSAICLAGYTFLHLRNAAVSRFSQ